MSDNQGSYYTFLRNRKKDDVTYDNYLTYQQERAEAHSLNSRKNVTFTYHVMRREMYVSFNTLHV